RHGLHRRPGPRSGAAYRRPTDRDHRGHPRRRHMNAASSADQAPQPSAAPPTPAAADRPWRRLDARMIWVDAAQTVISLVPAVFAVTVLGVAPGGALWP